MTETQKRIKQYQQALPHMKERVIAVAMLLVMSISMLGSSSFAWITLSRSPEVSSLATTIAANGNLEIALSDKDGKIPEETAVGDGGQDVTKSNLTWGNLVNLSSSSYGLDHLTLRPASLNTRKLDESPMYSVKYGSDGRVTGYITDFAYAVYNEDYKAFEVPVKVTDKEDAEDTESIESTEETESTEGTTGTETTNNMQYGVRAISSVTYKDFLGATFIDDQLEVISNAYTEANNSFGAIYSNKVYMKSVSNLVALHVNSSVGGVSVTVPSEDFIQLSNIIADFEQTMRAIGQVIVEMANLYEYRSLTDTTQYKPFTFEDLESGKLDKYKGTLDSITYFIKAWNTTKKAYNNVVANETMQANGQSGTLNWNSIKAYVNDLCDTTTATIEGYTAGMLADNPLDALKVIGKDCPAAVIHGGALFEADKLLEGKFFVAQDKQNIAINIDVTIKKIPIQQTLYPSIETSAAEPFYLMTDMDKTEQDASGGTSSKGQATAAETYAMAIDFWVRTNAPASLLILEGEVDTVTEIKVLTDDEGNPLLDEDGNELTEEIVTVVGYSGVNRVWDELDDPDSNASAQIPAGSISATQGAGSCYVFYPASPEEQEQSLKLLQSMRVAFVSEEAKLLAQAYMDTANAVEGAGRVTVPLVLQNNDPIEVDKEGNTENKYIMPLVQNEAARITALVYLDGTSLTNSEVLAAGSIKGQLNIQFGTNKLEMDAMDDSDVMKDYFTFDFAQNTYTFAEGEFDAADETKNSVTLQLAIEGSKPSSVKGNFISFISATQGARQEEFTMTLNQTTGYWEAKVPFSGPGNFQLRSIQVDGVDYLLNTDEFVYVTVPGLSVKNLSWDVEHNTKTVMTAETYYNQNLQLTLNSSSDTIPNVYGVFIGDNGSNVNVNFHTQDGTNYTGTASFRTSGNYELSYVYIDNVITPLAANQDKTLHIKLGLTTAVFMSEPQLEDGPNTNILDKVVGNRLEGWSFIYTMEEPLTIDVSCFIYDDHGEQLTELNNIVLNYSSGSVTNALSANMKWNDTTKMYEGTIPFSNIGVFKFQNLVVGSSNYITVASSAPTLTAISPDPMEYVEQSAYPEVTYALGDSSVRKLYVTLKNAAAVKLNVTLTNENGEAPVTYTGITNPDTDTNTKISTFTIEVPSDGKWSISELYATDVFYEGTFYTGDNALDLTDKVVTDDISSEFITEAKVAFSSASAKDGVIALSGEYMTQQTAKDVVLTVTDYQGRPITKHATGDVNVLVKGEYFRTGNNSSYVELTKGEVLPVGLDGSGSLDTNGQLTLNSEVFLVDGTYNVSNATLTINGKDMNITGISIPTVKIAWTKPEVDITAISPNSTTHSADSVVNITNGDTSATTSNGHGAVPTAKTGDNRAPGIYSDNKEAWVYYQCELADKTEYKNVSTGWWPNYQWVVVGYYHSYLSESHKGSPKVDLKLTRIDGFDTATLNFGDNSAIYNNIQYSYASDIDPNGKWETVGNKTAYSWSKGNTTTSRYIGYAWGQKLRIGDATNAAGKKTPAGTISANQLVVVDGVNTYTFTIDPITIHNPY